MLEECENPLAWQNRLVIHTKTHQRAILSQEQAIQIYQRLQRKISDANDFSTAKLMAHTYGVSVKTIRDIWNRRTWTKETQHLWGPTDTRKIRRKKIAASPKTSSDKIFSEHQFDPSCILNRPVYHLAPADTSDNYENASRRVFDQCSERDCPVPQQAIPNAQRFDFHAEDPFHDDWPYWVD